MLQDLRLDHGEIAAFLKSGPVAAIVNAAAQRVAAGVAVPAEVVVDSHTTDRAAASVTIKDARGRLWQVRDGVLTRAASAAGFEVKAQ